MYIRTTALLATDEIISLLSSFKLSPVLIQAAVNTLCQVSVRTNVYLLKFQDFCYVDLVMWIMLPKYVHLCNNRIHLMLILYTPVCACVCLRAMLLWQQLQLYTVCENKVWSMLVYRVSLVPSPPPQLSSLAVRVTGNEATIGYDRDHIYCHCNAQLDITVAIVLRSCCTVSTKYIIHTQICSVVNPSKDYQVKH